MPLTTIPVTIYLSFEQPAGITIAPQIVGAPDAWHYTSAPGDDRSVGIGPRVSLPDPASVVLPSETAATASVESGATHAEIAALRKAELDQFLASLPADADTSETELKGLSEFLHERLQADLDARPTAAADAIQSKTLAALVGRLQAEIRQLEDEAVQLRAELTQAITNNVGSKPRAPQNEQAKSPEMSARATNASVETGAPNAHDPNVDFNPPGQDGETPADTNNAESHASVETDATDSDDEVAPDVISDLPNEPYLSPRHSMALVMYLGGSTIAQIAKELKVVSSTVGRWMRHPNFVARYRRHVREHDHSIHRRLDTICDHAVEVMHAHVHLGSFRAAVQILKGRGYMNGQRQEPAPVVATDSVPAATAPPVTVAPAPPAAAAPAPNLAPGSPPFPQRGSLNGHAHTNGRK